jgi:hypothetical protein
VVEAGVHAHQHWDADPHESHYPAGQWLLDRNGSWPPWADASLGFATVWVCNRADG